MTHQRKASDGTPLLDLIDLLAVCLWLASLSASAILEYDQFPSLELITDRGWQLALFNICLAGLILVLMKRRKLTGEYMEAWAKNKWLFIFLAIAAASIIWTVNLNATGYKLILLICSTVGGAYFAIRFRSFGFVNLLTWFAVFCTSASLLIIFFSPNGIMQGAGHAGSWRGLFWHRNHTGSLMALFNMVFLVRLLMDKKLSRLHVIVFGIFYILTAVHVFGSRSATGVIIFAILNFLGVISYVFVNLRTRIQAWQYMLFIILVGAVFFFVASNLEIVFGILNRSPTMTGRTKMWPDLFFTFYLEKPVLGHGFGSIWMQDSFRTIIQERWGWSYQPYFSDNGYLDLLLNLGFVGLAVFLGGMVITVVRNVILVIKNGLWTYIFTLLILIYVILANLTYSFLFEVDFFVWNLFIMVSFVLVVDDRAQIYSVNGG